VTTGGQVQDLSAGRTGVRTPPLLLGTVLFLASELMFFGGLFAAYFTLRAESAGWPPAGVDLSPLTPSIMTAILLTSSLTIHSAIVAVRRGDSRAMRRWMLVTMALGSAFLGLKGHEWATAGFRVHSHAYGTIFFGMTGFHGLHVLGGLVLMAVILGRAAQGAYANGDGVAPEAVAYYWHFVDVVWVGLYSTIYFIK
jgi:cytochrome c oxidase subunit 3